MLSPSHLLINMIIAYEILHFQTILYYNSSVEAAKQNQKFPFHFLSAPPTPPAEEKKKGKENFWFLLPRPKGADEARIIGLFAQRKFSQRLLFHRRLKLPNPKGGKKPAPKAREWAKEPVAPRRIGTGREF
jgi:hypothetical protein